MNSQPSSVDDYISHYGVLGMKWGTRSGQKQTDKFSKKVDKTMQRYDRGSSRVNRNTFRELSRKSRKLTYTTNRRVERINRYLNRVKGESVNNLINKYTHNPEKVKQAKEYLRRSQIQTAKLSEIRSSLIDVKLDVM